jgi:hypothetical protein
MVNKQLAEANNKYKNPERRINAIYTSIIVSVLWGSLVIANNSRINDLVESSKKKDTKIDQLTRQNEDCTNKNYEFMLSEVVKQKSYQDSVNRELIKLKQTLMSR